MSLSVKILYNIYMNSVAKTLVYVGAINWLLIGLGYFFKSNLNVVNYILGPIPLLEAIVYILVGISALYLIIKR